MATLLLAAVFVLNLVISWWNAKAVGMAWRETKHEGGWPRLVAWSGAVMSACGFTWCYLIVLGTLGGLITHVPEGQTVAVAYLPPRYVKALYELGYVMIIIPILGSGIVITLHSWKEAWRERTLGSGVAAGYNTFAQVYNTYEAIQTLPGVFSDLADLFKGDSDSDSDNPLLMVVIVLAILALLGGVATTYAIARSAMNTAAIEARDHWSSARRVRAAS